MAFEFLTKIFKKDIVIKPGKIRPVVLLILDGWGIAPQSPGNAISQAKIPNMQNLLANYPNGQLIASGESVGLPANEVGNTEVGHLNMGAGRLILQDLKKINKAIEDGSFYENRALAHLASHVIKNSSKLHIMGLVGSGNVHSSLSHLFAILEFCKRNKLKNVYLHLFTDGRDSPPKEALDIVGKIEESLKLGGVGKIATICGRYYAMDRDRRWERTKLAYEAMVRGQGVFAGSAKEAISSSYQKGQTDEFILPTVILENNQPVVKISDNDGAIFFNFRIDRPRQLTMALTISDFKKENLAWEFDPYAVKYGKKHAEEVEIQNREPFERGAPLKNLFFTTMTQYQKNLPVSEILFPPEEVQKGLSETISVSNLKQIHMSESEKERFVTYYFDGLKESRFPNEETKIVASPKVPTYDKKPQMSVFELVYEFKKQLSLDIYNFFVVNFANADMVAHTGNLSATITAINYLDQAIKEFVDAVLLAEGTVIITADHGNAEELVTYPTTSYFFTTAKGTVNTDHSNNPVPVIIINRGLQGKNMQIKQGTLGDIAPTVLGLMNLAKPPQMTGRNLLATESVQVLDGGPFI